VEQICELFGTQLVIVFQLP